MKLAELSVKRPVFASVMMLTLIVFGLFSYGNIGVDQYPDVDFPVVTITTVYPGADPSTIEEKVVDKLEESVNTISGIESIRSTSQESVGVVVVQFALEVNPDQAVQDVRDKVSAIVDQLPDGVDPPRVEKFDIGAAPILSISLSGDIGVRELTRLADEKIKQRLQTLNGVGSIDLVGGREREVHVELDPAALEALGLTVSEVIGALQSQHVDIPGGRIDEGRSELSIVTNGEVEGIEGLEQLVVRVVDGVPVRLGEVARVLDTEEEARSYSSFNGVSAVSLVVRKQAGANTVEVAHAVRAELERIEGELPEGISLAIPVDNSPYIEHSIADVEFDLVFGGLLAVLIILAFLRDWRATLISAVALPTSVVATFAFIDFMGFTFNVMSMLALSLSIGILIDDAIVVVENIHRHLEMGKGAVRAAIDGTSEIGLAVLATTASIMAVFVPVAFMDGIIGRFFLQFGLTVAFAVAVSMFVAFTATPMLAALLYRGVHHEPSGEAHGEAASEGEEGEKPKAKRKWRNPIAWLLESILVATEHVYRWLLRGALRFRWLVVLLAIGSFVASLSVGSKLPFEFSPQEDRGELKVVVDLPPGTGLAATRQFITELETVMRGLPGAEATFATIGGGSQGTVDSGSIQLDMVSSRQRRFSQAEAMVFVRKALTSYIETHPDPLFREARIAVEPVGGIGGASGGRQPQLQFSLQGGELSVLQESADKMIALLQERGGFVDLDTNLDAGKPEVRIDLDRTRMADLNVPVAAAASVVRAMYAGDKIGELTLDGERVDVRARVDERYRRSVSDIEQLHVRSSSGRLVSMAEVARLDSGEGAGVISRLDRAREVTVNANLDGRVLGEATQLVEEVAAEVLPEGVTLKWSGTADTMADSAAAMGRALLLALILIYLILAAQFESFVHPFTIMLAVPLSLIGAFGGLALTGMSMNIFSMIGLIMLMGLVVKNSILLVDYTIQLRATGLSRKEALLRAGPVRLRPILMTTLAMVVGMLPVAMALSEGGEQRAPMAVTVIGGLVTSMFLTLLVVPVAYSLIDGGLELMGRLWRRIFKRSATAPEAGAPSGTDGTGLAVEGG